MLRTTAIAGLALAGFTALCGISLHSDDPSATAPVASEPPATYEAAQEVTRATPGFKNLRRIGLAFHGYHDVFGRFPSAVQYGPDGKTPYSWRVELLPALKHYVDGIDPNALSGDTDSETYNELIRNCGYDITQAWDSPANAAALKEIPDVYRHPNDDSGSFHSAYYAIIGPETAFDENGISQYSDIRGWVASTLMIVESRSREPWTKPVDILYASDATVPRLGGFTPHGYLALTCDGGVHFIHESTPRADIRALITKDQDDEFTILGIPYEYSN